MRNFTRTVTEAQDQILFPGAVRHLLLTISVLALLVTAVQISYKVLPIVETLPFSWTIERQPMRKVIDFHTF